MAMNENLRYSANSETTKEMMTGDEKSPMMKNSSTEAEMIDMVSSEERLKIQCGIGPFKPRWLQRLACKEILVLAFSLSSITQGMFFTYSVSVISTLEKRFQFSSVQTGIVLAGNDISAALFAPFLGYYLNYRHRPRWLGIGLILTATSCFVNALPHFIYGPGDEGKRDMSSREGVIHNHTRSHDNLGKEVLCGAETEDHCASTSSVPVDGGFYLGPLIMIFISQFIVGISMSIFYSIGLSYIDDNISKKTMSLYYGFFMLLRTLGPILGFLLGGKCLEYWVDLSQPTNISPEDPRWIGAWWVGYLLIGSLLIVVGIGFSLLPFKLPATLRREKKKILNLLEKEELKNISDTRCITSFIDSRQEKPTEPTLRNMVKVVKKLIKSKIWTAFIFNTTVAILAISGYEIFKPKYLENQFRKSASEANYYVGSSSLIANCFGLALSSGILRWVRPGPRFVTGYNIFVTLFGCFSYLMKMAISCPQQETVGYMSAGYTSVLTCSSDCDCTAEFSPVCSEDNVTSFYSACYAGCTYASASANHPTVYSGCSCIGNASASLAVTQMQAAGALSSAQAAPQQMEEYLGTATKGYCPEPCDHLKWYIVLEVITITIYASGKIGSFIVFLRAVDDEDKGISIGLLELFIAIFGFIPAPLIMGQIIDSSCIIWEEKCGVRGNCWLYDTDKFRVLLHSVAAGILLLSILGDLVMFKYADELDLYGEKEDHSARPISIADADLKVKVQQEKPQSESLQSVQYDE